MLDDKDIGRIIKEKRQALNMTQTQLGERLGVGASAVNKWELGIVTNIKRDMLQKLSLALRIHPATLIGLAAPNDEIVLNDLDFTPAEIAEIRNYVEFVKSKRNGGWPF